MLRLNSSKRKRGPRHGTQSEQIKQDALAEKKAAEAKEKWAKAQENTKHKQAQLRAAKEDEEKARAAFQRRQAESDAVK